MWNSQFKEERYILAHILNPWSVGFKGGKQDESVRKRKVCHIMVFRKQKRSPNKGKMLMPWQPGIRRRSRPKMNGISTLSNKIPLPSKSSISPRWLNYPPKSPNMITWDLWGNFFYLNQNILRPDPKGFLGHPFMQNSLTSSLRFPQSFSSFNTD